MSQQLENTTPFFSANVVFINELYQKYSQNPASVDASWAEFFSQNHDEVQAILADYNGPSWGKRNLKVVGSQDYDISSNSPRELPKKDVKNVAQIASKDLNIRLQNLIANYKRFGHLASNLDPLGLTPSQYVAEIDLKHKTNFHKGS
jgi:2-oxoglutarate dehydrogenase E1 component